MKIQNLLISKVNKYRRGVKVFWWRPADRSKRNFGDEITPIIIEKIWGIRCLWTRLADCDMVGAGSIIDIVNTYNPKGHPVHVWGSGLIENGASIANQDLKFNLVRGPLTSNRVSVEGKMPVGDPGLLVSRVFTASKTKEYKVGIVPHMKDLESDAINRLSEDCLVISPYQTPEKVVQDITSCEIVFSSSLHGLIFADSFKVPNFRIKHNELEGGDYKFNDYYLSTNRKSEYFTLDKMRTLTESSQKLRDIKSSYVPIANLDQMQAIIVSAFPFQDKAQVVN